MVKNFCACFMIVCIHVLTYSCADDLLLKLYIVGSLLIVCKLLTKEIVLLFLRFFVLTVISCHAFCGQMFHLIPTPQGSFYVLNDIFRLNYAWRQDNHSNSTNGSRMQPECPRLYVCLSLFNYRHIKWKEGFLWMVVFNVSLCFCPHISEISQLWLFEWNILSWISVWMKWVYYIGSESLANTK